MGERTASIHRLLERRSSLLALALSVACGSTDENDHAADDDTSTTGSTVTTTVSSTSSTSTTSNTSTTSSTSTTSNTSTATTSSTSTTGAQESCSFGVVRTGSEGEACDMARVCTDGEQRNVACNRVGFFDFACQCDVNGEAFVARDVDCETLADVDFINEQCGYNLPGDDGVYDPIVVTDSWEDPAFEAPAVSPWSCDAPSSTQDDFGCTWRSQCDEPVALDCVLIFDEYYCRCLLDDQYYRQFTPGIGCDALDAETVFAGCKFPLPA